MELKVNGKKTPFDGATLQELLARFELAPDAQGVAVAVNGEVVMRGEWKARALCDGDAVEIVRAVQGG
jgi:sulfur carrier protein